MTLIICYVLLLAFSFAMAAGLYLGLKAIKLV